MASPFRDDPPLHPDDEAAFAATTCYAANRCQWDLGCPLLDGCRTAWLEFLGGDDG